MNARRTLCLCTALLLAACSSSTVGVGFYGDVGYYDDPWYWGGCCVDPTLDAGDGSRRLNPRPTRQKRQSAAHKCMAARLCPLDEAASLG